MMDSRPLLWFFCFAFSVYAAAILSAQMTGTPPSGYRQAPGMVASAVPKALREIGFDQNIGQRVPLDTELIDERGRSVKLGEYFGQRPVVLTFVYYSCPMLCTQVLSALTSTVSVLSLDVGKDFDIVTISFDPREKPEQAVEKKAIYLERYRRPTAEAGWHFLTGNQEAISKLTKAAGFRYVWDEETKQFAHPTGVIVLTPDGRLARYLFGVEYGPRDLRLALLEASDGRVGTAVDTLLLYCYHYDPMRGRYGLAIIRTLRITGALTVLALVSFIVVMLKREARGRRSPKRSQSQPGPQPQPLASSLQPPV